MAFILKSFQEILADMISDFLANSALNDLNKGSVIATFLEAAASEDFNQYYQMLAIISSFNLDTVTGSDLDNRAVEYGLDGRIQATFSSGSVTISDSSFTKIYTQIYAGLPGPNSGQTVLYANDTTNWSSSGTIIVGRGTANAETVSYGSITPGVNYDTINLSSGLANDHGVNETIILSQGGNRVVSAGSIVFVPASDYGSDIPFSLDYTITLLDGEDSMEGVNVTASVAGTVGNIPGGSINSFSNLPFSTAVVTNPDSFNNAVDIETDDELRARIKDNIQSLARGTQNAIKTGIIGLVDTASNKRVVSANLIEGTTVQDITQLIIDDGGGLEPSYDSIGFEEIIESAIGGEEFLQTNLFPIVKASVVTIESQPYAVSNGMTLIYEIDNVQETVTFFSGDFLIPGAATAQEIVTAINARANLVEARTLNGGFFVELRAKTNTNEGILIVGGTANSGILNFPTNKVDTIKLYKYDGNTLETLQKDGSTATVETTYSAPYNFSSAPTYLDIGMDNELLHSGIAGGGSGLNLIVDSDVTNRFSTNNDLVDQYVTFLTGTNAGVSSRISSTVIASGNITITGGLTVTSGDTYVVNSVKRVFFDKLSGKDFVNSSLATAQEVADVLNRTFKNTASVMDPNIVQLKSKLEDNGDSQIIVFGGTANSILGFPTTESNGSNKDYTFNRFNGQIQLVDPLVAGESVTAGTRMSRGFLVNTLAQPYNLLNGDTLTFVIDGGSPQVVTFLTASFSNINAATAQEVVNVLNSSLVGSLASVTSDFRISIRTNTYDDSLGSIYVSASSGNAANLGFTENSLKQSILSHTASLISGNAGPYNFVSQDNLIIILDDDIVTKTFPISMSLNSTVVVPTSVTQFTAKITSLNQNFTNKFLNNSDLIGFRLKFVTATNAGNIGHTTTISNYVASTGVITLTTGTPLAITANDTFIIIPITAANVVTYINSNVTSAFSLSGIAELADNGTKVQLSTLTDGSLGDVNVPGGTASFLTSALSNDGSGNSIFVQSSLYQIGMDIDVSDDMVSPITTSITAINANTPVVGTYELVTANAMPVTVANNAKVVRINVLDFSPSIVRGVDGYKYYTGLIALTQKTVDGVESDPSFPGIKAAGVQIEVLPPIVLKLSFEVNVVLDSGFTLSNVIDDVRNAITSYVNATKVGEEIILNEIVERVMSITGIIDMEIISPVANVAVASNQIARVSDGDVVIG